MLAQLPAYFPVQPQGVVELVLKGDDAARGLDGRALVDQLTSAGGDAQLAAGVTAVAAFRTQRSDQPGLADGPEKGRGGTENVRGPPHGVGGIVVIVEVAGDGGVLSGRGTFVSGTRRGTRSCVASVSEGSSTIRVARQP